MAKKLSDGSILLENVTLSFPHILEPNTSLEGAKPKYGCALLMDKDSQEAEAIETSIAAVAKEAFGAKGEKVVAGMKAKGKFPLKDGDLKEELAGYAGRLFINANSGIVIPCYKRDRTKMNEQEIREMMYAGATVHAIVSFYKYSHKTGGDGVGIGLKGLQFVKGGDRLSGGGVAKAEDFPELEAATGFGEEGEGASPWE
jgi:hypothetical protein